MITRFAELVCDKCGVALRAGSESNNRAIRVMAKQTGWRIATSTRDNISTDSSAADLCFKCAGDCGKSKKLAW